MKRWFIVLVVMMYVTASAVAQSPVAKGKAQFNAGIGLSAWHVPVYAGFDIGVHRDITVGGELSFNSYGYYWPHEEYYHSIIGISGNGNYHFNSLLKIPSRWDLYAGLNLGFFVWNSPERYNYSHSSGIGLGGQIGGRYYFTPKFGINLEFGGGNAFSGGKFGVSFRL